MKEKQQRAHIKKQMGNHNKNKRKPNYRETEGIKHRNKFVF